MSRPRRIVALFDANVLYPAPLRDLLIRLVRTGVVGVRWTDRIHDEWVRGVLRNRSDLSAEQLQRTRRLMDAAVPGALAAEYERHIAALHLPDPDDRHVLAAAIEAGADVIVTFNLADFPPPLLAPYGIEPKHPDDFVMELITREAAAVVAAARAQRSAVRNPPSTPDQYLATLEQMGLRRTVEFLRSRFGGTLNESRRGHSA